MALVGSRNLDPPEDAYIAEVGLALGSEGVERALDGAAAVYVAIDADGLDPGEGVAVSCPSPPGSPWPTEALLRALAGREAASPAPGSPASSPTRETRASTRRCAPWGSSRIRLVRLGRSGGP